MKKKLFLMIALLCAVVQGVWATEWDDVYELTHAGVYINNGVVKVNK
jgi:hypothetical protein